MYVTFHEQIGQNVLGWLLLRTLDQCISRTLGARVFILGIAIEVGVYCQTGNESLPMCGCGGMYDQVKSGRFLAKI